MTARIINWQTGGAVMLGIALALVGTALIRIRRRDLA